MKKLECVNCKGKNVIKRGIQKTNSRKTNSKPKQIYYCRDCCRRFVLSPIKGKGFDARVILNAISYYNLGNTLEESSKFVNRMFKVKTSKSSVHNWLNEFKNIYSYYRIRERVLKYYGKDVVYSKLFKHRGLTYNYKYHNAKLDFFGRNYNELVEYLKNFEKRFPHKIFEDNERCSRVKIRINVLRKDKENYACRLARFVLGAASDNYERHDLVENFMLVNDTATVAVEVPVWFWEKNIKNVNFKNGENFEKFRNNGAGLCGHIDILQLKYGKIYVLDFKPDAAKEKEEEVCSQLYFYARGLSFRTGIPLNEFRCAWFDDKNYFEFDPAKADVRW